jgi:hypothetical protein
MLEAGDAARDFSAPGGVTGLGDGRVSKREKASLPLKPLHAARLTYMRAGLPAPASSGAIRAAGIDPPRRIYDLRHTTPP